MIYFTKYWPVILSGTAAVLIVTLTLLLDSKRRKEKQQAEWIMPAVYYVLLLAWAAFRYLLPDSAMSIKSAAIAVSGVDLAFLLSTFLPFIRSFMKTKPHGGITPENAIALGCMLLVMFMALLLSDDISKCPQNYWWISGLESAVLTPFLLRLII